MMMCNLCMMLLANPEGVVKVGHKAADEFVKMDPYGIGMAFIAMSIVFIVLAVVYLIFKNLSKGYLFFQNRSIKKQSINIVANAPTPDAVEAEVTAAISMALYLYRTKQHDEDSLKMTIQRISKLYSPWSSKLYMLNQPPRR
jgi:glutaconyl-CoA/methylmalonyl-CoA decarboxylase subunit delta